MRKFKKISILATLIFTCFMLIGCAMDDPNDEEYLKHLQQRPPTDTIGRLKIILGVGIVIVVIALVGLSKQDKKEILVST
ncbi:MAG: hypothetical protein FWE36_00415 [Erysipelotrichales bacterium]|nr:hypothetical protein [Erysipelotrichales bacterium]